jgi:DNA-binding protein WhiA
MSFAHEVKSEVLKSPIQNECCKLAFLSSVIHSCGELTKNGGKIIVQLKTDMDALFAQVSDCLKTLYGAKAQVATDTEPNINKSVRYVITLPESITNRVLFDCGIAKVNVDNSFSLIAGIDEHIIENDCCARSYVKGVFATASTSNIILDDIKGKNRRTFCGYHWEFNFTNELFADDFSNLLFTLNIKNNKSKRKNLFILYIKEAEMVSDLFAIVGAVGGLLKLQNEMAIREVRNNINRQNNCLNANISKTVHASLKQVVAIKKIKDSLGLEFLPKNLQELCSIRLAHPDESLENLTKMLSNHITKSGINHQFAKILKIADNIDKKSGKESQKGKKTDNL